MAGKLKAAVTDSITLTHPENGSPAKLTGVFFYSSPLNDLSDTVSELCIYEKMVSSNSNGVIFIQACVYVHVHCGTAHTTHFTHKPTSTSHTSVD